MKQSDQPQQELIATLTQIVTQKSQDQDRHAVRAIAASFKPYLDRFDEVKDAAEKGVSREHRNMQVNGAYVSTLCYSYNPSEVTFAALRLLKMMDEISSGKGEGRSGRLVIAKGTLYGLARLLGYYNLYRYLSQVSPDKSDSRLLPMLCNLAIPIEQILEQVDKTDTTVYASSWLEEHLPPIGNAPNPCCFMPSREAGMSFKEDFLKYRSDYWMSKFRSPDWEPQHGKSYWISVGRDIAQEIIATEMSNLLDFRKSLYLFLAVLAPSAQDEHERSYDDPVVAVKEVTEENGRHCYHIELSDEARFSGSRSFIVTVHDEGEIELSEDEIDG